MGVARSRVGLKPYVLAFFDIHRAGPERDLIDRLQALLLELGTRSGARDSETASLVRCGALVC